MPESAPSTLAKYAVREDASLGRTHQEPRDALRSAFALDRHRIVSSAAFRRLQYKTQVFVNDAHDHFRTRLTHSLEVAQIARRLAVALKVNEQLAEAIALAHDLGHPPFGHAGETALGEQMAGEGGFEHNLHSLRIVEYLEHPYPEFRGLNLSYEIREALVKHATTYDHPSAHESGHPNAEGAQPGGSHELLASGPFPSVEGQVASVADRFAYDCHDLEDALGAGLIDEADLASITLWTQAARSVRERHPGSHIFAIRRPVLDLLLDGLLEDVVCETDRRVRSLGIGEVGEVRRAASTVVALSAEVEPLLGKLETFLADRVYHHPKLVQMDTQARQCIEKVFDTYINDPEQLPKRYQLRIDEQGVRPVVCDYVAGMTDRFCRDEFRRLVGSHRSSWV